MTKLDAKSSANGTSTNGRISNQATGNQTRQPNCELSELSHPSFGDPATEDFPNIQKTTSSTANISNKSQSSTIASDLEEELCMVTAESLQGRAFQVELEAIAARLLPNHDFVKEPLHFRLLDIDQANACYLVNSSPPTFCFTRGLLTGEQGVKSVDELAFVVAHELAHYQIRKEYENDANSKLEEGLADALAIKAIHQAGYSPLAGLNFTQTNMSHPDRISQFLEGLMDPHTSDLIRISVIEAALTDLYINKGSLSTAETPLAQIKDLIIAVQSAKYESYVNRELEAKGYTELSLESRVQTLTEMIHSMPEWTVARASDIAKEISKFQRVLNKDEVLADLTDAILELWNRPQDFWSENRTALTVFNHLYITLNNVVRDGKSWQPIGRLCKIDEAAKDFIEAKSGPQIKDCAKQLLALLKDEPLYQTKSPLLGNLYWGAFHLNILPGEKASWNRHALAALNGDLQDGYSITQALLTLGIFDPRLAKRYPDLAIKSLFPSHNQDEDFNDMAINGDEIYRETLYEIRLNENGHCDSHSPNIKTQRLHLAAGLVDKAFSSLNDPQRHDSALEFLQTNLADWNILYGEELENLQPNYVGLEAALLESELFFSYNSQAIDITTVQEAIVDHFRSALDADPDGATPLVHQFFSTIINHFDSNDHFFPFKGELFEDSPFLEFAIDQFHGLFTAKERWGLLAGSGIMLHHYNSVDNKWDLLDFLETARREVSAIVPGYPVEQLTSWDDLSSCLNLDSLHELSKWQDLISIEARALLCDQAPSIAQITELAKHLPLNAPHNAKLHLQLERIIPKEIELTGSLENQVEQWKCLYDHGFFHSRTEADRLLKQIVDRIKLCDNFIQQRNFVEGLLHNSQIYSRNSWLINPEHKRELINIWCDTILKQYGHDTGASDYQADIKALIENLIKVTNPVDRFTWLKTVALCLKTPCHHSYGEVKRIRDFYAENPLFLRCCYYDLSLSSLKHNRSVCEL